MCIDAYTHLYLYMYMYLRIDLFHYRCSHMNLVQILKQMQNSVFAVFDLSAAGT